MFKNPWFTLLLGLMVGLVVGYVLAERQSVPPARMPTAAAAQQGLPTGHPPMPGASGAAADSQVEAQAAELRQLLAASPGDRGLMVALGNLYFDAARWEEARLWYENGLEGGGNDPNVVTDLAVVYRNLQRPERSLELLQQATAVDPDHWQAWYNTVIVLHFDLHRHDEAEKALSELERLEASGVGVPDLTGLQAEVRGG